MQILTTIKPVVLDGQEIYPSNHAIVAMDPVYHYQWDTVSLPNDWANQGYYYEIWDTTNKPVVGFKAKKLTSSTIDLHTIDPSLSPGIRIVLFKPTTVSQVINVNQPIYFSYTEAPNYQLFGLMGLLFLIYVGLLVAFIKYRLSVITLWQETKLLLKTQLRHEAGKQITIYAWLIISWSGLFGFILGTYLGGIQLLYLLVKLPFLLLAALLFSLISLTVLSLLLGIKASAKQMVMEAVQLVAITALGLAVLSPIMWFYINLPQAHDELLVSMVLFFCIAGALAAVSLYRWLRSLQAKAALILVGVWVVIYGMVLLQFGWLLRPWVGITDAVQGTVPFTRVYSGNVFVELFNTINRTSVRQETHLNKP